MSYLSVNAIRALADGLKLNKSIHMLDLSSSSIILSNWAKPLSEAFRENQTLKSLNISGCEISQKSLTILSEELKHNCSIKHWIFL